MCIVQLTHLGLSEKEAQVYLMLFRMGSSPVSVLAKRVNLKRVTVYAILDALCVRGLAVLVETDQGRRYLAQDLQSVLDRLEMEQLLIQEKLAMAETCMKELRSPALSSHAELKRVRFHEGSQSTLRGLLENFSGPAPLYGLLSVLDSSEADFIFVTLEKERTASRRDTFYKKIQPPLFSLGSLLVQEDTVGFLNNARSVPELMLIHDAMYAHYVKEILFAAHFEIASVGAKISRALPVKG